MKPQDFSLAVAEALTALDSQDGTNHKRFCLFVVEQAARLVVQGLETMQGRTGGDLMEYQSDALEFARVLLDDLDTGWRDEMFGSDDGDDDDEDGGDSDRPNVVGPSVESRQLSTKRA